MRQYRGRPAASGEVRADFSQCDSCFAILSEDRTMGFRRITAYAAVFVSVSGTVVAEEATTVQSLIKQGFAIVGTIAVPAGGAGLLLQKKDELFFCFAAETPSSPAVTTRYCKPVH
jgi:hypothetical protein